MSNDTNTGRVAVNGRLRAVSEGCRLSPGARVPLLLRVGVLAGGEGDVARRHEIVETDLT